MRLLAAVDRANGFVPASRSALQAATDHDDHNDDDNHHDAFGDDHDHDGERLYEVQVEVYQPELDEDG